MAEAEGVEPSHAFATWLQFSKLTHYRSVKPPKKWYSQRDSNPHCTGLKPVASAKLGYRSIKMVRREGFEPSLNGVWDHILCQLGYLRITLRNRSDLNWRIQTRLRSEEKMVGLAWFKPWELILTCRNSPKTHKIQLVLSYVELVIILSVFAQ